MNFLFARYYARSTISQLSRLSYQSMPFTTLRVVTRDILGTFLCHVPSVATIHGKNRDYSDK